MTELERLQGIYNEKCEASGLAEKMIEQAYNETIRTVLENSGFDMSYLKRIVCSISDKMPIPDPKDYWSAHYRDYIRVDIEDKDGNGHDISLDINRGAVSLNNCCTGNWTRDSWYYHYIKAMVAIADATDALLAICTNAKREDMRAATEARWAVENEQDRLRKIENEQKEQARNAEMEKADWLGVYGELKCYEKGYIKGADKQPRVLRSLYKIVKKTAKLIYLQQYQATSDPTVFNEPWYFDPRQKKKAEVFSQYSNYEPVDASILTINPR
jgi:hypothetical protein